MWAICLQTLLTWWLSKTGDCLINCSRFIIPSSITRNAFPLWRSICESNVWTINLGSSSNESTMRISWRTERNNRSFAEIDFESLNETIFTATRSSEKSDRTFLNSTRIVEETNFPVEFEQRKLGRTRLVQFLDSKHSQSRWWTWFRV